MGVNKVVMNTSEGEETLIDLTSDTVTAETLADGATAHDASGNVIEGTMPTTGVLYTEQTLTAEQQEQARVNIDAVGNGELFEFVETNIADLSTLTTGMVTNSGTIFTSSAYQIYKYTPEFIPVEVGDVLSIQYTVNGVRKWSMTAGESDTCFCCLACYDEDTGVLGRLGVEDVTSFTVPDTVAYVKVTFYNTFLDRATDIAIVKNATSILPYTPYGMEATIIKNQYLPHVAMKEDVEELNASLNQLSSEKADQIPTGVKAEASGVVDKALSRNDTKVFRFLAVADAHHKTDDDLISAGTKELGQGVGEVLRMIGVDLVANLGDICWGSSASNLGTVLEEGKEFNLHFLDSVRGQTQIWTEGNHETAWLTESQIRTLIYSHNKVLVQDADHFMEGYGYIDFPAQKIRVICLNTDQHTGGDESGVSDTQLKWFAETALNMEGKTDWNVITMGHHPIDYNNITMYKNCTWVLDAFMSGENFSFTTNGGTSIAIDYSTRNCQYVAHFHGHAHAFSVVKIRKRLDTGEYEELDAWEICIPNACYLRNNQYLNNGQYTARYSTATTYNKEDVDGKRTSFNLVTVCLDEKIIYADNYGAGVDRVVSYAEGAEEVVTYNITRNLANCTSSNSVTSVISDAAHTETLTAVSGYTMDGASVAVTMGGIDVTDSVYADGVLNIASVTGDIVITATAVVANLLVIGQRTYDPMTDGTNLTASDTREMDYSKMYPAVASGGRGPYSAGKLTYTPDDENNGFTFQVSSTSGYGPEFPVLLEAGKTYTLRLSSVGYLPYVRLLKFNSDTTFNEAILIANQQQETNIVESITAEDGYLYSIHFTNTKVNTDFTVTSISLVENT